MEDVFAVADLVGKSDSSLSEVGCKDAGVRKIFLGDEGESDEILFGLRHDDEIII